MSNLPDQRDLVLELKQAYNDKGLTLSKLLSMMPENSKKISQTVCHKIFYNENSEDLNYEYNTLVVLAEILLGRDDNRLLLDFKRTVIEVMQAEIDSLKAQVEHEKAKTTEKVAKKQAEWDKQRKELEDIIDFRTKRISRLDDLLDDERKSNQKLNEVVMKLVDKCDNCAFHKPN